MTTRSEDVLPVSVVIPTIGRPKSLAAGLESLARCGPRADEIVVVDQSRGDEVPAAVGRFADVGARCVSCSERGVGLARNIGLREAKHELVLMTDDDCTVAESWIGAAWALMETDPDRILTGQVLPVGDPAATPATREGLTAHDYTGQVGIAALYSGNMAVHRSQLLEFGEFDEQLETAEDNDLCYRWLRSGRRLFFEPELVVWHHDWRTPEELTEHYVTYWRGQGAFYAKHLAEGDLRMLRFIARDMLTSARAVGAAVVRGRPRWTDWRRGMARGLPAGLLSRWRWQRGAH
jgi:GT2 family glycosyltransferase